MPDTTDNTMADRRHGSQRMMSDATALDHIADEVQERAIELARLDALRELDPFQLDDFDERRAGRWRELDAERDNLPEIRCTKCGTNIEVDNTSAADGEDPICYPCGGS